MKLSISLPDRDVATLDDYVRRMGLGSRSAALQRAVALLRGADLEREYAAAWDEWRSNGEAEGWDLTVADGAGHAAR